MHRSFVRVSSRLGGLGTLNDGDTSAFLQWKASSEPIRLLFAFDTIRQFHSIDLDMKCASTLSTVCTVKVDVGIFELVASSARHRWTNRFRSITINSHEKSDDTTLTHLILSVGNTKGQFVIIEIVANEGLALSEVTFDERNDDEHVDEKNLLTSSIYIESNLRRLESAISNLASNGTTSE
jgi:hypothetical protein